MVAVVGFVAELIQNAQRAKAKHLDRRGESTFTIEDDGKGCKNPEDVLLWTVPVGVKMLFRRLAKGLLQSLL